MLPWNSLRHVMWRYLLITVSISVYYQVRFITTFLDFKKISTTGPSRIRAEL